MKSEVELFNKSLSENILEYFKEYRIIIDIPNPKIENIGVSKTTETEIFFYITKSNRTSKYKITWQLYLAESITSINKN